MSLFAIYARVLRIMALFLSVLFLLCHTLPRCQGFSLALPSGQLRLKPFVRRLGLLPSEHLIYQLVLQDPASVRLNCQLRLSLRQGALESKHLLF